MSTALRTRSVPYLPIYRVTSPVPIREADECDVSQVQRLQDHVEIGSERVVVVSNRGFARPAEAATVIRDHTVAGLEQRSGLFLPRSPAERPPMNEHDGRPYAVIFVIEVDRCGILFPDTDHAHRCAP